MSQPTCLNNQLNAKFLLKLLVLVLITSQFLATKVFAVKIGGNGGIQKADLKCPINQLSTGITLLASDSVEQIKLRCHRYQNQQKWAGSATWTSLSGTLNPKPTRNQHRLFCPKDKWVTKIAGVTKQGVVQSIKVTCSEIERGTGRNKRLQVSKTEELQYGSQGNWRAHNCDSNAHNTGVVASVYTRYGWKLDSMAPKCGYFKAKQVTPTISYPSLSHNRVKAIAASPQKAQFSAKNRTGDYGDYCISELNKAGCVVRFSEEHPGWHSTPVEKAIPNSLEGQIYQWKMRNCNNGNPVNCGEWSSKSTFMVLPKPTQITNLRNNQQLVSKNVLFKWKNSPQADSYRIMILDKSVQNLPNFYSEPEMLDIPGKRQVIKMDRNRTSIRVNLDSRFSDKVKVRIAACKVAVGAGRQCHDSASLLSFTLPAKVRQKKGR